MNKVHFQPPISCSSIELPDLPPESLTESLPQVTHAKSKQKGENILKRGFDIFRKLSSDKSRAHVGKEVDKKIGASQYEKSSTIHIKTRTQAKVSFSKPNPQNEPAVKSESRSVRENPVRTRDDLNLTYLKNGLKKVTQDMDDNKRNDLATTIRQLFGDLGGEPDEKTLVELKTVTDKLSRIPEVKNSSIALSEKIDEALSKKAVATSQNLVKAEKIAMPALDGAIPSAKAEKLREPQPKLSALDMNQDEFLAALDKSGNIDELTTALERVAGSSQPIFNQPTSHWVKAEKITMPAPDGPILSAKAEKLREPQPKLSALDMNQDELLAALDKSGNIDELTTAIERMAGSSQPIFNQPNSAVPLSAEDELERELKELNDEIKRS